MNRADRRREKREIEAPKPPKPQNFMTEDEFVRITKEYNRKLDANAQKVRQVTKEIVTETLLAALLTHLHYESGFGRKRLQRIVDGVNLQISLANDRIIETDELVQVGEQIRLRYKIDI